MCVCVCVCVCVRACVRACVRGLQGVNCSLRWLRQKDEAIHGMVAGFFAGGAMYFYNSLTIALFCSAKVVEVMLGDCTDGEDSSLGYFSLMGFIVHR